MTATEQEVESPADWARQILEQPWGRLVADSMSRTLNYVPNDRPRQLAGHLLPIVQRADALERELQRTTRLLEAIGQWLTPAGEYATATASQIDAQIVANNRALGESATD